MKLNLFTVLLIATIDAVSPRGPKTTATTSETIELSIDSAANNTEETTPYPLTSATSAIIKTEETTAYPRTTADTAPIPTYTPGTTGEITVTITTANTTATTETITTTEITTLINDDSSNTIITFVSGLLISILLSI